jgi:hypothetical protein
MPFQEQHIPQKVFNDDQTLINQELGSKPSWGKAFLNGIKFFLFLVIGILLLIFFVKESVLVTESGYIVLYDNPFTGNLKVFNEPGLHWKIPLSPVTRYKQVWIVDFGTGYAGKQLRENKNAIELRFSDTYKAAVPATFRYKLPTHPDRIKDIHRDFTTFDLLIDALLIPISRGTMVSTAALYTSEEFFQGGISQFKADLEDQIQNGIYKTKRLEVEVKQGNLTKDGTQAVSTQFTNVRWKTMLVRDKDGHIERLQTKSIRDYGIELKQVTLDVPVPEKELVQLLADKKRLIRAAIKKADELALIQEEQKIQLADIAKKKAIQLANTQNDVEIKLAHIERDEKVKRAQKAKELALLKEEEAIQLANIEKDKKVKLAMKAKELTLVKEEEKLQLANIERETKIKRAKKAEKLILIQDSQKVQEAEKAKELFIAEAELKIQEVHLKKAKFEAKAIMAKGNAEAAVLKAKYEARTPEIFHAEIKKEIAEIIYSNLKGINVTMPHNIVNLGESGNNSLQTNLDVLSSFATIQVMEGMEKKALENNPTK